MTPSRWLLFLIATLLFAACLQGERNTNPVRSCSCWGLRCLDGQVARLRPNDENPCLGCHIDEVGWCAEGCGQSKAPIEGCTIGALCRTWDRVAEGSACTTDRDCEPGELREGEVLRLVCESGRCQLEPQKWAGATVPARQCEGDPEFGPHPACGDTPCQPIDQFHARRVCGLARCIDDRDCPSMWHCRCVEEGTGDGGVKAHRWCVPNVEAGYPEELISKAI